MQTMYNTKSVCDNNEQDKNKHEMEEEGKEKKDDD
jgi:hypothetical protein